MLLKKSSFVYEKKESDQICYFFFQTSNLYSFKLRDEINLFYNHQNNRRL